jgi:hypothetical protein
MNPKKTGARQRAPHKLSPPATIARIAITVKQSKISPYSFTLQNDQVGDVYAPGAITGHSVRPLPLEVGHSDHKCVQVWRDETHAVYKHFGSRGQFIGWEAIKIKLRKPEVAFGKSYPWREVYPGNEDFGTYALSVGAPYDLEHAISKAKTLKVKNDVAGRTGKTNLEQDGDVMEQEQTQTQTSTQTQTR